ncbi:MAG: thermonuclease family protein [Chitinophagales bacterium]|nr:thermonuclease family protein [Chitinophagales bacterium]
MGFTLIKGHFAAVGFQPDGDSVKFKATNPNLFKKLTTDQGKQGIVKLNKNGLAQLRIEGIDALETHYLAGTQTHQHWNLADAARHHLLNHLGFTGVQWGKAGKEITGVNQDNLPGYILTKKVDNNQYGRPVAFVFKGTTPLKDGADVFLDVTLLKKSLNYEMMKAGHAYPMYYKNLYYDLRNALTAALKEARQARRGVWSADVTNKGVTINTAANGQDVAMFPKLFRRLMEHINKNKKPISTFADFLEKQNERLFVLGKFHEVNFGDIVEVKNKKLRLTEKPENLIFMPK